MMSDIVLHHVAVLLLTFVHENNDLYASLITANAVLLCLCSISLFTTTGHTL